MVPVMASVAGFMTLKDILRGLSSGRTSGKRNRIEKPLMPEKGTNIFLYISISYGLCIDGADSGK
jgi:hypothetical protein